MTGSLLWLPRDVSRGCYAVLDGISPAYPPVMGRLHTCYSPVRRSPARKASFPPDAPRLACVKPVASVHPEPGSNSSLLFIFVLFFFKLKKQDKSWFLFLSWVLARLRCSHGSSDFLARTPTYWLFIVSSAEIDLSIHFKMTLVLFLVYCKYFNVLFFGRRFLSRRKIFAKLQLLFLSAKLFKIYFRFSLRKTPSPGFRLRRFSQHLPESECKITAFFFIHQIFSDVFSLYPC